MTTAATGPDAEEAATAELDNVRTIRLDTYTPARPPARVVLWAE